MPVKILIDKIKIHHKVNAAWKDGLPLLSNEILNDCNLYCKEESGALIASSLIHSKLKKGKLIWQTPYARRQYWEIRTAYTDSNPNASWKWCEVAKQNHFPQWQQQANALFNANLQNRGINSLPGGDSE